MSQTIDMKTNFYAHQTHLKWSIADWDKIYERTGGISSGKFNLRGLDAKIGFMFNLDVNNNDRLEPVLSVYIENNQPFLRPVLNAYVFKLDNIKTNMIPIENINEEESTCSHMFLLPNEHNIQELYIRNNTLTIYCDIKYYEHVNKIKESSGGVTKEFIKRRPEEHVQEKEKDFTKLYQYTDNQDWNVYSETKPALTDYAKFFKGSKLCDVTFVFESEEIRAHKIVLAAASPYFSQKFIKEAANESNDYRIDCTDDENLSPSILRGFLEYVYGIKTVKDLQSIVKNLYILAKEYKMAKLKESCETYTRELV